MEQHLTITYREYATLNDLTQADRELMEVAIEATRNAYSPYSHFCVGAAVRMANGAIVSGSNQENGAYPSGLCAERTAIFAASSQYPQQRDFEAIAIVGRNAEGTLCEASPCGACRQVLLEYEQQQGHPLRILCYTAGGSVREIASAKDTLPFGFEFTPPR